MCVFRILFFLDNFCSFAMYSYFEGYVTWIRIICVWVDWHSVLCCMIILSGILLIKNSCYYLQFSEEYILNKLHVRRFCILYLCETVFLIWKKYCYFSRHKPHSLDYFAGSYHNKRTLFTKNRYRGYSSHQS